MIADRARRPLPGRRGVGAHLRPDHVPAGGREPPPARAAAIGSEHSVPLPKQELAVESMALVAVDWRPLLWEDQGGSEKGHDGASHRYCGSICRPGWPRPRRAVAARAHPHRTPAAGTCDLYLRIEPKRFVRRGTTDRHAATDRRPAETGNVRTGGATERGGVRTRCLGHATN
jgi:hypothetical protein